MNIEEIKRWLKENGVTRQEFAEKVGVRITSVNNWLSGYTQIPAGRMAIIEKELHPAPQAAPALPPLDLSSVKIINVRLTAEELDMCIRAARACHMELEAWARLTILEATRATLGAQPSIQRGKQP